MTPARCVSYTHSSLWPVGGSMQGAGAGVALRQLMVVIMPFWAWRLDVISTLFPKFWLDSSLMTIESDVTSLITMECSINA